MFLKNCGVFCYAWEEKKKSQVSFSYELTKKNRTADCKRIVMILESIEEHS